MMDLGLVVPGSLTRSTAVGIQVTRMCQKSTYTLCEP